MTSMASHPIDVATLIYVFNTMNWNRYFVSFGNSGKVSLQPESNGKYALDAFPGDTSVTGLAVLGFK